MPERKPRLHSGGSGAALAVRVLPRASKNEIAEIRDDGTIRIRLTSPPVDGKANAALIQFLADVLDIPRSKIEIIAGTTGRDKLVSILDLDSETVSERILKYKRVGA